MPSIREAALALAASKRRALAASAKSIVRGGALLNPSQVGRPLVNRQWPTELAVERLYKVSSLVYRSAFSLATAVGTVRWQVEVKTADHWDPADDHPLQALLDQPHKAYDRQTWNELVALFLVLVGNALIQKTPATGKPITGASKPRILEMQPLIPDGINPVPDPTEWVKGYVYAGPPRKTWTADEILHVMLPDPGNPYWGMSPLLSARKIIGMDLAAVDWNASSMRNRAIADGVLAFDAALSGEQYEEAKDQVWEQHQGVDNAHEPWVLGGGVKWLEMSRTPVEMDFNETRMRTREDILSATGMPPVMAGYFENATLANADVSRRMFWEDNAIPAYIERIVGSLNRSIVPHFGQPGKLRVSYDISGIPAMRDDLVKKVTGMSVAVRAGMPYNDALDQFELDAPKIPGPGDVPFGLETLKAPAQPAPTSPPPPMPGEPMPPKHHRPSARKVGVQSSTTLPASVGDQEAPAIRRAFLAIIAKLKLGTSIDELATLLMRGDSAIALQKLGAHLLPDRLAEGMGKVIQRTAERGAALAAEKLADDLGIDLILDDHRFSSWFKPYIRERVAQLTTTTESAARDLFFEFADSKLGPDAGAAGQLLRNTWGLHRQQASAVRNAYAALIAEGKSPAEAAAAVAGLAKQRLEERGATIAEHESLVAANRGYGIFWEQVVADGHASSVTATWYTAEDGDVDDECASLADQEIEIGTGQRFTGASGSSYREPPAHLRCRCGLLVGAIP